jgi:hypothetical protein
LFRRTYWRPQDIVVLVSSLMFNYAAGHLFARTSVGSARKLILAVAVGANLAALPHYKYMIFLVASLDAATGLDWSIGQVVLPLGISFFSDRLAGRRLLREGEGSEPAPLRTVCYLLRPPDRRADSPSQRDDAAVCTGRR